MPSIRRSFFPLRNKAQTIDYHRANAAEYSALPGGLLRSGIFAHGLIFLGTTCAVIDIGDLGHDGLDGSVVIAVSLER